MRIQLPGPEAQGSADLKIILANFTASQLANSDFTVAPAGVSGHAIDLALADRLGDQPNSITITINGVPSGWTLNGGTQLADGSWTAQTNDPAALSITPAATFTGAMLLGVTESWSNP